MSLFILLCLLFSRFALAGMIAGMIVSFFIKRLLADR